MQWCGECSASSLTAIEKSFVESHFPCKIQFPSAFQIFLLGVQAKVKLGVQFAFDILSSEGCESDSFFSKNSKNSPQSFANFQSQIPNFPNLN